MNNNGERINKYNEILIKFLNDLVNGLSPNNELIINMINDVTSNFSAQLANEGLDIADNGVKTLLANALNEYIKILKYHFDHSDIHRIDISHENNEDINSEVNQVTSNLTNAVNDMNKIPEYQNLINSVKSTLVNYFVQTFPNKENVRDISDKIISDCIISCLNSLSASKAEEFFSSTLPNLISIGDDIVFVRQITEEEIAAINLQVNDERDAFIYDTMDVEIKEGFENGVVTLSVTDAMGKTILYEGREAMEKLVSYNQLFEASRPGKKADISKWEHLLEKMYEEDAKEMVNPSPVEVNMNNMDTDTNTVIDSNNLLNTSASVDNNTMVDNTSTPFNVEATNTVNNNPFENVVNTQANSSSLIINNSSVNDEEEDHGDNNEINDLLNKMNDTMEDANEVSNFNPSNDLLAPTVEENNNASDVNNNDNNNDNNIVINNTIDNATSEVSPINNNEQVINSFLANHEANIETPSIPINISSDGNNTMGEVNSNLASNALNSMINATQTEEENEEDVEMNELKSMVGIKEDVKPSNDNIYGSNFSFVPAFNNPNQDRDDFIKKATGISIEEDVDNQGDLYLKVTEPTGREQIYTGKEAVNMIKNYNRTYLDANPDKKVDTSLIDKFE